MSRPLNRLEDVPGSWTPGYQPSPLRPIRSKHASRPGWRGIVAWEMGEALVVRFRDDEGLHLTVSRDDRLPSWDELKQARYLCLPLEATFALTMPPPSEYVDHPLRPYIMELTEVVQARARASPAVAA